MLLLATTLNYMDRQTLASTSIRLSHELGIDAQRYGLLERDFGYAFALGGLFFGMLVDRVRLYFLFPAVLTIWSLIGCSAAYAVEIGEWLGESTINDQAFVGLRVCRAALGFFEAAQWPMALVTTSRLLSSAERPLGNSLLQSGTALGSIVTPIVVQLLVADEPGAWSRPFTVVGLSGIVWIIPWFLLMRPGDLARPAAVAALPDGTAAQSLAIDVFVRRFIVCAVLVVAINLTWHFYRAWLTQLLHNVHGYSEMAANYLTSGYFLAADVGCLGIGFASRWLIARHWGVHTSRTLLYAICAATVAAGAGAALVEQPTVVLVGFALIGAGGLGLFPIYYSFSQEMSGRHQGKISGLLGFTTWTVSGAMQGAAGSHINEMRESADPLVQANAYRDPMILVSLAPLVGLIVLLVVWKHWSPKTESGVVQTSQADAN